MNFNNDLAWVVDFRREEESKKIFDSLLSIDWCKISLITELLNDSIDEEHIISFFDNQLYVKSLKTFWKVKNPQRINVFIIADSDQMMNASLFAFYLKMHLNDFLRGIELLPNTGFSCNLISYWEFSWSKKEEDDKANNLYALNLFQNIRSKQKRPFDFVFIFKNLNSGIKDYEYRLLDKDQNYFDSKILSLIIHVSNKNQNLINKKLNQDKWCVSFGSSYIYFDSDFFYAKTAKEISNLLVQDLITKESNPWQLEEDKPLMEKISSLEFTKVFNSIKFQSVNNLTQKPFNFLDLSPVWDWFGLSKLTAFFTQKISDNVSLSETLYKLKESKVDFLFETYNEMRIQVESNFRNFVDFKNNNIKTPEIIFEEYFQAKPFSFQAYRIGIESLVKQIENQKKINLDNYNNFYPNSPSDEQRFYNPCSMSTEVNQKYLDLSEELNNKGGLVLDEKVKNQFMKIKESAENIPHPLSLLLKTSFLSTLIVLLIYIPLSNVFSNKDWIVYSLLTVVFIIPYIFIWNKFNKAIESLYNLFHEFEALSKYYVNRKLIDYINRTIDSVYDDYINLCKYELVKVENKLKESDDFLNFSVEYDSNYLDSFSFRSAMSIAEKIPPIKINIDGSQFETRDLKGNTDKLFQYFKQTVDKSKIGLNSLFENNISFLNTLIIEQLKSLSDNISSTSDLLFTKEGVNIQSENKTILFNLLPPYNNNDSNIDNLAIEIIIDSINEPNLNLIRESFGVFTSQIDFIQTKSDLTTTGDISVNNGFMTTLILNQPKNNIFDLFSSSIGGNKLTFIDQTKTFFDSRKEDFNNIRDKIIKIEIDDDKGQEFLSANNDNNNKLFETVLRGYDLSFDKEIWEINTFPNVDDDSNNEINDFVKKIRTEFRGQFEQEYAKKLNK